MNDPSEEVLLPPAMPLLSLDSEVCRVLSLFCTEVSMTASNKRLRPVFIRVTPEQYAKMEKRAMEASMSMSRYVAAAATGAAVQAAPVMTLAADCSRCSLNNWPDPNEFDVITNLNRIGESLCNLDASFRRAERDYRVDDRLMEDVGSGLDRIWAEFISLNDFLGVEVRDKDDDELYEKSGESR